jgi:ethanolaminephosphotransferase
LCGILYFTYYFLDCSDGKQARRLGLSSPLGFIMDHNLDSFSLVLLTLTAMNVVQMVTPIEVLITYLMSSIPFFIATWEEYVTGVMEMPSFSGVDEGAVLCSSLFIISGLLGETFWSSKLYGIKHNMILITCFTIISIFFMYVR